MYAQTIEARLNDPIINVRNLTGNQALNRLNYLLFLTGVLRAETDAHRDEQIKKTILEFTGFALTGDTKNHIELVPLQYDASNFEKQINYAERRLNRALNTEAFIDACLILLHGTMKGDYGHEN